MSATRFVARLVASSSAFNTLNTLPKFPIFLQRSPSLPDGDTRGILGMEFEVFVAGLGVVQTGKTGPDGKLEVQVPPGGSSTLRLTFGGKTVAEYQVSIETGSLSAVNTTLGLQQRLRILGYQIGRNDGADGVDGQDPKDHPELERSILDFLVDESFPPQLTVRVAGAAGQVPQVLGYDLDGPVVQKLMTRAGG
jgi:hypothetical protein